MLPRSASRRRVSDETWIRPAAAGSEISGPRANAAASWSATLWGRSGITTPGHLLPARYLAKGFAGFKGDGCELFGIALVQAEQPVALGFLATSERSGTTAPFAASKVRAHHSTSRFGAGNSGCIVPLL